MTDPQLTHERPLFDAVSGLGFVHCAVEFPGVLSHEERLPGCLIINVTVGNSYCETRGSMR
jgi:hypothetical protein